MDIWGEGGPDGKTLCEKTKGKQSQKDLCEFGEATHHKITGDNPGSPTMEPRWAGVMWHGMYGRRDEIIVGIGAGLFKARCTRRKPCGEGWPRIHGSPSPLLSEPASPYPAFPHHAFLEGTWAHQCQPGKRCTSAGRTS